MNFKAFSLIAIFFLLIGCTEVELIVHGGSGSGTYTYGEKVNIVADDPLEGMKFYRWDGLGSVYIDNPYNESSTVRMTKKTVEVRANYVPDNEMIDVKINNGTGSGSYSPGTLVSVVANVHSDSHLKFEKWIGDIDTLSSQYSKNATVRVLRASIYLEAIYEKFYEVKVNSGTGTGFYKKGVTVYIKADSPNTGFKFKSWRGDVYVLNNLAQEAQNFKIETDNLEFSAVYEEIPYYNLTVNNGSGSGSYYAGKVIPIKAVGAPSGKIFDLWAGNSSHIKDSLKSETTLEMPDYDIIIYPKYKNLPLDKIIFEAESFISSNKVTTLNAGGASGGKAIQFGTDGGFADYTINVQESGRWEFVVRAIAKDAENNGLFVAVDGVTQRALNDHPLAGTPDIYLPKGPNWLSGPNKWQGSEYGAGPVVFNLTKGRHTFRIYKRKIERPILDKVTLKWVGESI